MAMFEKGEKMISGPGTVIGSNVKLVGALKDTNDIVVHGAIEGEVASERSVNIGETAHVKGPVSGQTVLISGRVDGSVKAVDRLELLANGKIFGDITCGDLVIQSGSTFVGQCAMDEKRTTTPVNDVINTEQTEEETADVDGDSTEKSEPKSNDRSSRFEVE